MILIIVVLAYLADMLLLVPKYTKCKYDHTSRRRKLVWKGFCILIPLLVIWASFICCAIVSKVSLTVALLSVGMLICAVGDIVLEIRFSRGGMLFGFGHIFYIAALISLGVRLSIASAIIYVVFAALGTMLTLKFLGKKYRTLLLGYNLVISGSIALALPLVMTGTTSLCVLGIGISALAISDWLLARNKAFGSNYAWSLLSLVFYFGGQILISMYPYLNGF